MSDSVQVDVFRGSLKRCLASPQFLSDFYDVFMGASTEVREKFKHTDFDTQARVLADSLFAMAIVAQSGPSSPAWGDMRRLAVKHSHLDLDIRPEMYDTWLDCLVKTAERHDPEFAFEVEQAWRQTLSIGIDYMRSNY